MFSYQASVEVARSVNDLIFLASGLEGMLACSINVKLAEIEDGRALDFSEYERGVDEILETYEKSGFALCQCLFLSDYVGVVVSSKMLPTSPLAHFDLEYCSRWIMRIWNDGGLDKLKSAEDQIMIVSKISELYGNLKLKRKYGFFLRQLVLLMISIDKSGGGNSFSSHNTSLIVRILNQVLATFDIPGSRTQDNVKVKGHYKESGLATTSWFSLKMSILEEALIISEKASLARMCIWFLFLQLCFLHRQRQDTGSLDADYKPDVAYSSAPPSPTGPGGSDQSSQIGKVYLKLKKYLSKSSTMTCMKGAVVAQSMFRGLESRSFVSFESLNTSMSIVSLLSQVETVAKITQIRPLNPKHAILVVAKESATVTLDNPFIYNPFAATEVSKSEKLAKTFHLIQNEGTEVTIEFSNPFFFDLRVESFSVVYLAESLDASTTAADHIVSTDRVSPFVLHKDNLKQFSIRFIPRAAGTFKLCGVRVRFGNGWTEYFRHSFEPTQQRRASVNPELLFNQTDFAPESTDSVELRIAPPMPLLKVVKFSPELCLFSGQRMEVDVVVMNISEVAVDFMEVLPSLKMDFSKRASEMAWDEDIEDYENQCIKVASSEIFQLIAPAKENLAPGEQTVLKFAVYGLSCLRSIAVDITYGSHGTATETGAPKYTRKCSVNMTVDAIPAVVVEGVEYVPFDSSSPLLSKSSIKDTPLLLPPSVLAADSSTHSHLYIVDVYNSSDCKLTVRFFHTNSATSSELASLDPRHCPTKYPPSSSAYKFSIDHTIQAKQRKRICIPFTPFPLDGLFEHLRGSSGGEFVFPDIKTDLLWMPPVPVHKAKQYSHWFNRFLKKFGNAKNLFESGIELDETFWSGWRKEVYKRNWFWYMDQFSRRCVGTIQYSGDINGTLVVKSPPPPRSFVSFTIDGASFEDGRWIVKCGMTKIRFQCTGRFVGRIVPVLVCSEGDVCVGGGIIVCGASEHVGQDSWDVEVCALSCGRYLVLWNFDIIVGNGHVCERVHCEDAVSVDVL